MKTPIDIYFDYTIVGDEESNNIAVRLQYRIGGPGGRTALIHTRVKVFDGEALSVDKLSRMNGFWYEVTKPLEQFEGEHQITVTTILDLTNKHLSSS